MSLRRHAKIKKNQGWPSSNSRSKITGDDDYDDRAVNL